MFLELAEIASKQGHDDVSKLTPTDIAIEVCMISYSEPTIRSNMNLIFF